PLLDTNHRVPRFAPPLVREPDDRDLLYGRVSQNYTFHFDRRNVFAAAYDDVFQTIANLNIAVRMHDRDIAGVQPAARQSLLGRFRVIVVAGHDHVAAGDDLSLDHPVLRNILALFVDDA